MEQSMPSVDSSVASSGVVQRPRERHGMTHTDEYRIWAGIRARAYTRSHHNSGPYERHGIGMCEEWASSFLAFLAHVGPRPSKLHSIDRIETTRGYEPGNVRWTTRDVQLRNKSCNRNYTFDGRTQCLADWAREVGLSKSCLRYRLVIEGWTIEQALATPSLPHSRDSPEEKANKTKARSAVAIALKAGRLVKPKICPRCGGSDQRIESHHHNGFAREHWVDVVWLCRRCRTIERRTHADGGIDD